MEYSKIVAVTGLPGLYELINTKGDGAVVRSLDDSSTKFAASRSHNFSHLESIEVYTTGDNVNLVDIFHAMEKQSGSLPDLRDNAALKKYFEKAYPEIDFDRVYKSDLKKMVKWYGDLKRHNIDIKLTEEPTAEAGVKEPVQQEEEKEMQKQKKTTEAAAKYDDKLKKKLPKKK
jgi:hypothetical protein